MTLAERIASYSRPDAASGCIIWTGGRDRHGYGRISCKGRKVRVHRVAWEIKNGPIPTGLFACHRCDNRACVNPDHIFTGTHQENMDDMVLKGRSYNGRETSPVPPRRPGPAKRGSNHPGAVLTEEQVLAIRADRRGCTRLSRIYGVSHVTIIKIRSGAAWGHLA